MTDLIDKVSNAWDKTLTDILKGVKRHKGKIKAIAWTVAGIIVINTAINNFSKGPEYESSCETYQGYSFLKADGEYIYAFDPKKREERNWTAPKYAAFGDPELRNSLERGKRYCFTIKKSYLPLPENRIISIEPDNSLFSESRELGN